MADRPAAVSPGSARPGVSPTSGQNGTPPSPLRYTDVSACGVPRLGVHWRQPAAQQQQSNAPQKATRRPTQTDADSSPEPGAGRWVHPTDRPTAVDGSCAAARLPSQPPATLERRDELCGTAASFWTSTVMESRLRAVVKKPQ